MDELTNTVANNEDLITFNLEELWDDRPVEELDIEPFLFKGLVVKEQPFRNAVKEHDWEQYAEKHVAIYCSTDAILPQWATMLVTSRLHAHAASVVLGRREDLLRAYYTAALERHDWSAYEDRLVVVKGCGSDYVPESAYLQAAWKLQDVVRKLMYGEACSSVPLWRRPREQQQKQTSADVKKPDLPTGSS